MSAFRSAMPLALSLARAAADMGEVPVGAVVTGPDGLVLATAHNRTRADRDPIAHAEILAIRAAARALSSDRLAGCTLWVTLEPCAMCAGAIAHARLARLVYAAADPKGGGVDHGARVFAQPTCHHRPEVIAGIAEAEAGALLRAFFAARRAPGAGSLADAASAAIAQPPSGPSGRPSRG